MCSRAWVIILSHTSRGTEARSAVLGSTPQHWARSSTVTPVHSIAVRSRSFTSPFNGDVSGRFKALAGRFCTRDVPRTVPWGGGTVTAAAVNWAHADRDTASGDAGRPRRQLPRLA